MTEWGEEQNKIVQLFVLFTVMKGQAALYGHCLMWCVKFLWGWWELFFNFTDIYYILFPSTLFWNWLKS